jgi:hypothetical protein
MDDPFSTVAKSLGDPRYAAGIVALVLVFAGVRVLDRIKPGSPIEPYILQILGMLFILPVVMITAIVLDLGKEAVTGVIGTIVGYVFGTSKVAAESKKLNVTNRLESSKTVTEKPKEGDEKSTRKTSIKAESPTNEDEAKE